MSDLSLIGGDRCPIISSPRLFLFGETTDNAEDARLFSFLWTRIKKKREVNEQGSNVRLCPWRGTWYTAFLNISVEIEGCLRILRKILKKKKRKKRKRIGAPRERLENDWNMQRVSWETRGSVGVERRWTDKRFRRGRNKRWKGKGGQLEEGEPGQRLINFSLGVIALETAARFAIPRGVAFEKLRFKCRSIDEATNFDVSLTALLF